MHAHADAGLYAKPEPGHKLREGGIIPHITLFSLPQTHDRALCATSAFLGDLPNQLQESKGWGIALGVLKTTILTAMPQLVYNTIDGKEKIVIGMRVQHVAG